MHEFDERLIKVADAVFKPDGFWLVVLKHPTDPNKFRPCAMLPNKDVAEAFQGFLAEKTGKPTSVMGLVQYVNGKQVKGTN